MCQCNYGQCDSDDVAAAFGLLSLGGPPDATADGVQEEDLVLAAAQLLSASRGVPAVGGVFVGDDGGVLRPPVHEEDAMVGDEDGDEGPGSRIGAAHVGLGPGTRVHGGAGSGAGAGTGAGSSAAAGTSGGVRADHHHGGSGAGGGAAPAAALRAVVESVAEGPFVPDFHMPGPGGASPGTAPPGAGVLMTPVDALGVPCAPAPLGQVRVLCLQCPVMGLDEVPEYVRGALGKVPGPEPPHLVLLPSDVWGAKPWTAIRKSR
jgi:hypothetical protein